jgi:hypothetical protein
MIYITTFLIPVSNALGMIVIDNVYGLFKSPSPDPLHFSKDINQVILAAQQQFPTIKGWSNHLFYSHYIIAEYDENS